MTEDRLLSSHQTANVCHLKQKVDIVITCNGVPSSGVYSKIQNTFMYARVEATPHNRSDCGTDGFIRKYWNQIQ